MGVHVEPTRVPAGEFKARCLQLIDRVAASGETLTITKRGQPVARLMPLPAVKPLFGALAGSVIGQQDIVAPVAQAWDAET